LVKIKIAKMLLSAFADEILAYYMYFIATYALKEYVSKGLESVFVDISKDELEDLAKKLMDRLQASMEIHRASEIYGIYLNINTLNYP